MRRSTALLAAILLATASAASAASADCPPDCFPGGGPAATDCLVEWGGIAAATASCSDGDPACDIDGRIDGTCTFALAACLNVGAGGCAAGSLTKTPKLAPKKDPAVRALQTALAGLDPGGQGCTAPGFPVSLKLVKKGLKPGRTRLKMTAGAGRGKDKDKLLFNCLPGAPSLAHDVQPIFTAKCATTTACHSGVRPTRGSLDEGMTFGELVNVPASVPKQIRVVPGNLGRSFLAQKILGNLPRNGRLGAKMPLTGDPLTQDEVLTILSWVAAGAPNN